MYGNTMLIFLSFFSMFKLASYTIALVLLVATLPALARGKKTNPRTKPTTTQPATKPTTVQPVTQQKSEWDSVPSDIRQMIELSKKYKGNLSTEKSQLETQEQYEARLTASQPTNLQSFELTLPARKRFKYYPSSQSIVISLKSGYTSQESQGKNLISLKEQTVPLSQSKRQITCKNGFGASFDYLHTISIENKYGIYLVGKESFENKRDPSWADAIERGYSSFTSFKSEYIAHSYGELEFKLPMDVSTARSYITSDEKELNDKLKFVVTIKPLSPFYDQKYFSIGDECGGKYNNRGGTSFTLSGIAKYAIVDIINLKLVDSSTGTVLLERSY
jgi:hypothetical protein